MRHRIPYAMVAVAAGISLATALGATFAPPTIAARKPSLTITMASTPAAGIVLDGQHDVLVSTFTFRTGREAVLVDTLTLMNCVATRDTDGDCADSTETRGSDAITGRITLTDTDNTVIGTGSLLTGVVTISDLALRVEQASSANVNVWIDTPEIDDVIITSGLKAQLNLNAKSGTFHAVGETNGIELTERDVKTVAMAKTQVLRNTAPTFAVSAPTPTTIAQNEDSETFRFDITANEGGDVTLNGLMFTIRASDNSTNEWNSCAELGVPSSFVLRKSNGDVVPMQWSVYDARGTDCSASTGDATFLIGTVGGIDPEVIAARATTTYALEVDTSWASGADDDSITVGIPSQTTASRVATRFSSVSWQDGTSAGTDINGAYLNLPITGNRLTF